MTSLIRISRSPPSSLPDYAGAASIFSQTCSGVCYEDFVLGDPSHYDTAYFEVSYVRVYGKPGELTVIQTSPGRRSADLHGAAGLALVSVALAALIWAL